MAAVIAAGFAPAFVALFFHESAPPAARRPALLACASTACGGSCPAGSIGGGFGRCCARTLRASTLGALCGARRTRADRFGLARLPSSTPQQLIHGRAELRGRLHGAHAGSLEGRVLIGRRALSASDD